MIVDRRSGVTTATLTDPAALAELLVEARTNAAGAGVDPTAAVASPDGGTASRHRAVRRPYRGVVGRR
ncbi:MAG: hypothetical protein IPF42_06335 [Candidatus Microthrix sp.]|nr:hypothetical protein [Candidatus Microthrix sp.]